MRNVRDLRRLQRAALRRLSRLRVTAEAAVTATPHTEERETGTTLVVIELYNCWYSVSRALYLSSAFRARGGDGKRITLNVTASATVDAALTHAIAKTKPRTAQLKRPPWSWADEPSWAKTSVLLDTLDAIGASNRPTVVTALGLPAKVLDHLPTFRHFFAHRNRDTARRLRPLIGSYAISPALRATEALSIPAGGPGGRRPQPLLLDWIDEVNSVVEILV
jgi:hypothetical protein